MITGEGDKALRAVAFTFLHSLESKTRLASSCEQSGGPVATRYRPCRDIEQCNNRTHLFESLKRQQLWPLNKFHSSQSPSLVAYLSCYSAVVLEKLMCVQTRILETTSAL